MRPKKPSSTRRRSLTRPGQVELVVHDARVDAGGGADALQLDGLLQRLGGGLLGEDVLAGLHGLGEGLLAREVTWASK
jgi:hypothetical protein